LLLNCFMPAVSHTPFLFHRDTLQVSSYVAIFTETIIYLQVGISLATLDGYTLMLPLSLAWINISRFVAVFFLSTIINWISTDVFGSDKRNPVITLKEQLALWHTGLRGSIALSLSLQLPATNQEMIVTTTCVLVLWTVFFNGGTTG